MYKKLFYILFLAVFSIFTTALNAQDPAESLGHSWTFNDGTANDYIGGANGTLMGAAIISEGSLLTVEPSSWLEMPADKININNYNEVTIEAWYVPVEGGNANYTMLAWFGRTVNTLGVDGYFITSARGDNFSRTAISCGYETTPYSYETGVNGPEYDDGELHHMVSTLTDTEISLYIDGQPMGSAELSATNAISAISPTNAYLAKGGYDGDATWVGEILEFNIYKKALTADQVLSLFNKGAKPTAVGNESAGLIKEFRLHQNFPNPFNPSTKISFDLPELSNVKIKVYDMLGNEVAVVLDDVKPAGNYNIEFNAARLSSGAYICAMDVNGKLFSNTMLLLK